jgi:hypothetical protein
LRPTVPQVIQILSRPNGSNRLMGLDTEPGVVRSEGRRWLCSFVAFMRTRARVRRNREPCRGQDADAHGEGNACEEGGRGGRHLSSRRPHRSDPMKHRQDAARDVRSLCLPVLPGLPVARSERKAHFGLGRVCAPVACNQADANSRKVGAVPRDQNSRARIRATAPFRKRPSDNRTRVSGFRNGWGGSRSSADPFPGWLRPAPNLGSKAHQA